MDTLSYTDQKNMKGKQEIIFYASKTWKKVKFSSVSHYIHYTFMIEKTYRCYETC